MEPASILELITFIISSIGSFLGGIIDFIP